MTGDLPGEVLVLDFTGTSQWDRVFAEREFFGVDLRKTTSSRTPGKVNKGIVDHRGTSGLHDCENCGRKRYNFASPHAPHWHDGKLVDCIGQVIR